MVPAGRAISIALPIGQRTSSMRLRAISVVDMPATGSGAGDGAVPRLVAAVTHASR